MSGPRLIALGCLLVACDPVEPPAPTSGQGSTSGVAASTSGGQVGTSGTTGAAGSSGAETTTGSPGPATFGGGVFPEFCPPDVAPSLEVGHGDIEFRPIGAEVAQLVMGHQGGYHVVIGLRGSGLDLAEWGSGHLWAMVDGEVVADYDTIVVMECDPKGQFAEALWINLIFEAQPEDLVGRSASVEIDFTDASEQVVSASVEIEISEDVEHL